MKIRLLADDSRYPNYAIMKISTYHKQKGDDVGWYNPSLDMNDTDILYHSRIFVWTKPYPYYPLNAKIYKGGTGFDIKGKLPDEIENITELDYSLYPNIDFSMLFTTRGCVRKCPFCLVSEKEGLIRNIPICSLNPNGKHIKVMDNNFIANPTWRENLEILKSFNQPLDFNSGIDLRLLNDEKAKALSECKIKYIHCAFDNYEDKEIVIPKLKLLTEYINPSKIICYVLIGFKQKELVDEDLERVKLIRGLGVNPMVMVYQDFNNTKYKPNKECKDFARYVNRRQIFKTCSWEEYSRSNFKKNKNEYNLFNM